MQVKLKVIKGPHLGAEFAFDQYASFVVGRNRRSQFRLSLKDPYLSRLHFYLEIKPPKCVLVDLASSNHTYVNGRRIDRAVMSDGDLIHAPVRPRSRSRSGQGKISRLRPSIASPFQTSPATKSSGC